MDKLSYALGMSMASSLVNSGLNQIDVDSFAKAFATTISGGAADMTPQEANQHIQDFFSKRQEEMIEVNLEEGRKFLEENKKRDTVIELPSGLQYEVITEGNGPKPGETDRVKCHYHGTLINGKVFDSSVERNEPISFPLNQVIAGWTEGVQLMVTGAKFKFFIPSELAYGNRAAGSIKPGPVLLFDVELLDIQH